MNANTSERVIIPMEKPIRRNTLALESGQFTIKEFNNESGTKSYRVDGYKRNGERVRKNFADLPAAKVERLNLETEHLSGHRECAIKATRLSEVQIALAESAFLRLGPGNELDITPAIDRWLAEGKKNAVQNSTKLDDAFTKFKEWLDKLGTEMRDLSKKNLRRRINVFVNSTPNLTVSDITPDTIDAYLGARAVSAKSKDNDRRAVSRFFSWCMERPRKWIATNPCRKEKGRKPREDSKPAILTLDDCKKLLAAAQAHRAGRLVPYVALCLFGGLRPFEAARVTLDQINLKDRELRLEASQTKTGQSRVVTIGDTLAAWLKVYKSKPVFPKNWRRDFDIIKAQAGFGNIERLSKEQGKGIGELRAWPVDVMRHTACSHYFRNCGSYGRTAEQFGNSEAIIKQHYQGRVSTEETKAFYALLPKKGGRK